MGATSRAHSRHEAEGWFQGYLQGKGIDIGCGREPVTSNCDTWDILDGDAQRMRGKEALSYDWVYSSHCLEHMVDPVAAVRRWWELVKMGGFLVVSIPDEDLYEQGNWPSLLNPDHKSTWTIYKSPGSSWSPVSRNAAEVFGALPGSQLLLCRLCDDGYDYGLHQGVVAQVVIPRGDEDKVATEKRISGEDLRVVNLMALDQTICGAESSIEVIVRKIN